jgi:hypothetical protein
VINEIGRVGISLLCVIGFRVVVVPELSIFKVVVLELSDEVETVELLLRSDSVVISLKDVEIVVLSCEIDVLDVSSGCDFDVVVSEFVVLDVSLGY